MTAAALREILEMLRERWFAATQAQPRLSRRPRAPVGLPALEPGQAVTHAFLLDLERAVADCAALYYAREADDALRDAYGPSSGESPVGYRAPRPGAWDRSPSFPDDPGGFHSIGPSYPLHQGAHAYRGDGLPLVPPPGTPLSSPAMDAFAARLRAVLASCRWIDWSGGDPRRCTPVAWRDADLQTVFHGEGNGAYIPNALQPVFDAAASWTEYSASWDGSGTGGPCHEPPDAGDLEWSGPDRFLLCPAIAGTYYAHAARPGVRYRTGNAAPASPEASYDSGSDAPFEPFGLGLSQGWNSLGRASADDRGRLSLVWPDRGLWDASGLAPAGIDLSEHAELSGCGAATHVRAGFSIDLVLFRPDFRIPQ